MRLGAAICVFLFAAWLWWPTVTGASAGPILFENVVDKSGVSFVMDNAASPRKHQIETMLSGVAIFDYNNDGWMDLYFVNGARLPDMDKSDPRYWNRLYRNNGDGTFTDVTEKAGVRGAGFGMGVAAADYDNDGWVDLYVTGVNRNQLFHNNGDGTFTDVTEKAGVAGLTSEAGQDLVHQRRLVRLRQRRPPRSVRHQLRQLVARDGAVMQRRRHRRLLLA